jgi:hypothetical protein
LALFHGKIPDAVAKVALEINNFTTLGRDEAVIGGIRGKWANSSTESDYWTKGNFLGGDFGVLCRMMTRQLRAPASQTA